MTSSRAGPASRAVGIIASFVCAFACLGAASALAEECRSAIGEGPAARLVERCIAVSPATHPPCNADNACALIESEVERGCRMLDDDAPAYCKRYRS